MEPRFLSFSEILEIHQDQIALHGGEPGIRDVELLKSAMGMPSATYAGEFLHTDIYEMAAAYLFHLAKNHPFVDGNKRAGVVAALVFLILNGHECKAPENDLVEHVIAIACGERDKAQIAVFIRQWTTPIA